MPLRKRPVSYTHLNAGRATFLPLDTVQPGVFRGKLSGSARLASSLVQADARYSDIVSNLLGRIIVVDDINEASRVARDNGFRSKVVTLEDVYKRQAQVRLTLDNSSHALDVEADEVTIGRRYYRSGEKIGRAHV